MKISEVTTDIVKEYINASDEKDTVINMLISASKQYILQYTSIKETELDKYEDLTMVLLILCSDFYDKRQFMLDSNSGVPVNAIVESILNMHAFNLV
jgi:hypothetical protein